MSTSATHDPEFAERPWMQGAEAPEPGGGPSARTAEGSRNHGWAALAHGSALLAWAFLGISPLVVVPLLVWQVVARREDDRHLAESCVEALNFQVNLTLLVLALSVTVVGLPLVPVVVAVGLVLSLVGTIRAAQGQVHRYPFIKRPVRLEAHAGEPPLA